MLYSIFMPSSKRGPGSRRGVSTGYGGGPGGLDDGYHDLPPPYGPRSPKLSSSYRAKQAPQFFLQKPKMVT